MTPPTGGNGSVTLGAMAGAPSTTVYVDGGRAHGTAVLPRTWLDSRSPALKGQYQGTVWDVETFSGATHTARLMSALQAIVDGTIKGSDIIELDAASTGAIYSDLTHPPRPIDGVTGKVTTRDPSGQNLFITFRTKRYAELPSEGSKVRPYASDGSRTAGPDAGKFFVVQSTNVRRCTGTPQSDDVGTVGINIPWSPTFAPERGSYYRFVGMETRTTMNANTLQAVCFGSPAASEVTSTSVIPEWLILDRCFIHGTDAYTMKAAVGLHCKSGCIVDSYIEDHGGGGIESQAIIMYDGPGPYKMVGNTLVGATETVMSGGEDSPIADMRPSDIEFRRNDVTKWPFWNPNDSHYDGLSANRVIKNLFELKNAQYLLVEGNVFRHCWYSAQNGSAFLLKSVNQGGGSTGPGATSKTVDATVRFNWVEYAQNMFSMAAAPSPPVEEPLSRVFIEHNIGIEIGVTWADANDGSGPVHGAATHGAFFENSGGTVDQDVQYNTCHSTDRTLFNTGSGVNTRGGFLGNVMAYGVYGVVSGGILDDGGTGTRGATNYAHYWPTGAWNGNLLYGVPSAQAASYDVTNDNVVLAAASDVGFVDPATDNFRIAGTYANYGADWTAVAAYITGVRDASVSGPNGAVSGGAADHLAITTQPSSSTQSGVAHAQQPAGLIQDSGNATVTSDSSTVTATLVLESGSGTARGTTAVACVAGAFSFAGTGLGVDSAGGCTAHWDLSRPGLPTISTASFTITPPAAAPGTPFRPHRIGIL